MNLRGIWCNLSIATLIPLLAIVLVHAQESQKNVVLEWNDEVLKAVRISRLGPPMVARALAVIHTCMFDAWAAYDGIAVGTEWQHSLRRPEAERTLGNKRTAISYAAYRASIDLFPRSRVSFGQLMERLGYDRHDTRDPTTPKGIGNGACDAVLAASHRDGANQLGDMTQQGLPYADYTGYSSVNPPSTYPIDPAAVKDPNRFQPLIYENFVGPVFLGAQWFQVRAFAGPYDQEVARVASEIPVIRYGSGKFEQQARELLEISAGLSDEQKVIAEYWTDGPNSELPAGHWSLLAHFVSFRDHHTIDEDVKLFFVLTNAVSDAGIATWTAKRQFDSVRPITAIPYLFRGQNIRAWGGRGRGTISMDGAKWMPYQPNSFLTPPFPEYPSGHSAYSSAGATILELWTGNERFGASVSFPSGSSKFEPEITPKSDITLSWPTFKAAADQAGISRRYGGLHFKNGDLAGRALGRLVAEKVWQKSVTYFGRTPLHFLPTTRQSAVK